MAPKKIIREKRQERARELKGVKLRFDELTPPAIPIANRTNSSQTTKKRRVTFADASTSPINPVKPLSAAETTTIATSLKNDMKETFGDICAMDITDADISDFSADANLDLVDLFDPNEHLLSDPNALTLLQRKREMMPKNFTSGRRQTLCFP